MGSIMRFFLTVILAYNNALAEGVSKEARALATIPFFSNNVEGTGASGFDFGVCGEKKCGMLLYSMPDTAKAESTATLRVQREAKYVGRDQGYVANNVGVFLLTAPQGKYYEWNLNSVMYNHTGGSAVNGNGAQNVAIAGSAFKRFKSGYVYHGDQIGPTWGGYFICQDDTGVVNPRYPCVGAEIDAAIVAGAGTDDRKQRIGLQVGLGGGTTGDHAYSAILLGAGEKTIWDNGISFTTGTFDRGIDFTQALNRFVTSAILMKDGQGIAWQFKPETKKFDQKTDISIDVRNRDLHFRNISTGCSIFEQGISDAMTMSVCGLDGREDGGVNLRSAESHAISSVSSSFIFDVSMQMKVADATNEPIIARLPACDEISKGREYTLVKADESKHQVYFSPFGADRINGMNANKSISSATPVRGDSMTLRCNGSGRGVTAGWWRRE